MKNAHVVINTIMSNLFAAEYRRFNANIDRIHEANKEASRELLDGFMYEGVFYKPSYLKSLNGGGKRQTLHLSLWPDMIKHLKDVKAVVNDEGMIRQILFKIIEPCSNNQHVRDAIPDCIIDCAPQELQKLERFGGPNFYHERDIRKWNAILPRIEFYATTRLLY